MTSSASPTVRRRRLAAELRPLAEHRVVVMGGFIASTEEGVTTTLGRGGSDFTASIVGAGTVLMCLFMRAACFCAK